MEIQPYRVLILCTGNSARSILAEVLFNTLGQGRFLAHSAGSRPVGRVHPGALEWLQQHGYATDALRSKSWDEFATPEVAPFDFIITVCDNAANEACPVWPGHPATAHWGMPDPAAIADPTERQAAFKHVAEQFAQRIHLLLELPLVKLDKLALHSHLRGLG